MFKIEPVYSTKRIHLIVDEMKKVDHQNQNMIQNEIGANACKCQSINEKAKRNIRKLLNSSFEASRLRQSEWKLVETRKRYESLCLFKINQDKLGKIANSQKYRRAFVEAVLKAKTRNAEAVNDLCEDLSINQSHTGLPPHQLSSTHLISSALDLHRHPIGDAAQHSPSAKSSENQFVHILNQFLLKILRTFDNASDASSACQDDLKLKNPISTSFGTNLDTYIHLAQHIRAYEASLSCASLEPLFTKCYNIILNSFRSIYEKDTTVSRS